MATLMLTHLRLQGDYPVKECEVPGDEGGISIRDGVPRRQNLRESHISVAGSPRSHPNFQ